MEKDHILSDEELATITREKGLNLPLTILFIFILLIIGAAGAFYFIITKKKPAKVDEVNLGTLVEVQRVERKLHKLTIIAQGTVVASKTIVIFPEATGRITYLHPQLVPGGLVKKGERLFKIDTKDTRISITEQQTVLEQAKARLAIEKGQQEVAKREWELFNKNAENPAEDNALALRQPQLKNAKVAVDAARARLSRAKLSLTRTSYRAPFDTMVLNESVEIGQLVSRNSRIATLVGTDTFWVQVSLPVENLPFIQIPDLKGKHGAKVKIEQSIGGKKSIREGRVIRLLPNLDPAGRMARLIVEIDDPLNLKTTDENASVPLLLNTFVNVIIEAQKEKQLVKVPRKWLHDGKFIYVYEAGKLDIREVDIAWRRENDILIGNGLEDGDKAITSRLIAPIHGAKLRLPNSKNHSTNGKKDVNDELSRKEKKAPEVKQ